jgi:hypothetical protein
MYTVLLTETYFKHSLGRNHLTGTIPTELGQIQSLSSLSLQFNDLSGTIPVLKNLMQLKALQVEGNDRLVGKIGPHNLLCQMRPKCKSSSMMSLCHVANSHNLQQFAYYFFHQTISQDHGPTPLDQEQYVGQRILRIFTASCIPSSGSLLMMSDRLECACCTECFAKVNKNSLY